MYICPEHKLKLVDVVNDGLRPVADDTDCGTCDACVQVCPGYEVPGDTSGTVPGRISPLQTDWGPIREIWEGYAADEALRYNGSSGALCSAIALYCLEQERMHAVLHTEADPTTPWRNRTALSRRRAQLLERTGSRYSPASPCDGLAEIESAPGACVFVGKPCDVAGLRKAQRLRAELDRKVGLAIGIFCAGTPSTRATLDLLGRLDIDPRDVARLRYRGKGWPGTFTASLRCGRKSESLPYAEAWAFLQRYRPFRCYLCPDLTSELADISCGDPWHRQRTQQEKGHSLVLVRTERGRTVLQRAVQAGYVVLERVSPEALENSQKGFPYKRAEIWGRVLTLRALGVPAPRFGRYPLLKGWRNLPLQRKIRSLVGTARRIITRRYYRPRCYNPLTG